MKKVLSVLLALAMCLGLAGFAAAEEQVTIEFYQMKDEGTDYYDELIAAFEAQYPNIHVEHTNVPDAETVMMTRMSSDQVPDVFTVFPLDAAPREQVRAGYVMELTGDPLLDNVNADILAMTLVDGKNYTIPVSLNMLGVYYNLDLFEKIGATVPATIEELYALCERFKAEGVTPFTFADKDVWTVRQFCDRASVTMLEDPVGLFEQIAEGKTTTKDSAELRLMGETIVKLRTYGQDDNLGTGYEQSIADFANGKAAMFFSGTFAYPEIVKSNPELKFAMFRYPAFNAENDVTDRLGVNIDTSFSISATTAHPEAAKLFVAYCTSPEQAQRFSDYDGTPSAIKGVSFNKSEFEDMFTKYVQTGKTMSVPSNSWPASFGGIYGNICQELIDNGDVDAWLQNLNDLITDSYNE